MDLEKIVCLLEISYHDDKDEIVKSYGSGFTASNNEFVFSCAHLFYGLTKYAVRVRRLDQEDWLDANIAYNKPEWDIVLLKVDGASDCPYGMFPGDCSLFAGQSVTNICNLDFLVGSFVDGMVGFPCVDDVKLPVDNLTCEEYSSTRNATGNYRIMGQICNRETVGMTFEKYLHPYIPLIQITGMMPETTTSSCGGASSSGSPVFNTKGEVVGMVAMVRDSRLWAIHCSILKEVLKRCKEAKDLRS